MSFYTLCAFFPLNPPRFFFVICIPNFHCYRFKQESFFPRILLVILTFSLSMALIQGNSQSLQLVNIPMPFCILFSPLRHILYKIRFLVLLPIHLINFSVFILSLIDVSWESSSVSLPSPQPTVLSLSPLFTLLQFSCRASPAGPCFQPMVFIYVMRPTVGATLSSCTHLFSSGLSDLGTTLLLTH